MQNIKKIEGGPFGDNFFYFREKKTKNENFEQSHCAEIFKRAFWPLWVFRHFSLLQNIKKLEVGPFEGKKIAKKSHSAEKN